MQGSGGLDSFLCPALMILPGEEELWPGLHHFMLNTGLRTRAPQYWCGQPSSQPPIYSVADHSSYGRSEPTLGLQDKLPQLLRNWAREEGGQSGPGQPRWTQVATQPPWDLSEVGTPPRAPA